ncbi:MAG: glycosyltransferase family 2 protein [Acidobacteria bacterium]|nr:glycosyltransferase family 2 protein [Acidobacteriota bacterium]
MYSHLVFNALFVAAVTLIWFMLAYQSLLFFLGYRYWLQTRRRATRNPLPETSLPLISLLVPCHNEERVLAHTLRALLALEYPPEKLEILIINDGSTDRTAAIATEFLVDPRVRLLEVPEGQTARGKAAALNFALPHARHPVLAIYDADNTPEPGALRPLAERLACDPRLGAAIGMYRAINRRQALLTRFLNIEGIGFQWIIQAGRWMLLRFSTLPGTNYVIHRGLVEALGGWDEQALTEDAELTLRVYQAGYLVQFVPASVTWEQEPETLRVWFRQRHRWVRGHNYLFRKYARSLLGLRPRRIGWELLYSLSLYYIFFVAILISDLLFVLSVSGLVRITVPGPYSVVWVFAYGTFVLQLIIALAYEKGEESLINTTLILVMYFSYCQLWIPVVARAIYDDFIARREFKWAKTERYEVSPPG